MHSSVTCQFVNGYGAADDGHAEADEHCDAGAGTGGGDDDTSKGSIGI